MTIKITYTASFGQLIGDMTENLDGSVSIKNPCVIQIGQNQLGLIPLLGTVKEDTLTIKSDEIKGGLFEPQDDIRNHYSSQFGGIQLITDKDSPALSL
jgi:hypothetical protein